MASPPVAERSVSLRAVALGLALAPLNAWWLTQIEYVRYSDTPTIPQLFFHCVALLLLAAAGHRLIARVAPRWAFSRGELIVAYSMLVVASNVASHDQLQILFTTIVYLHGMATPENRWADLVAPHVPNRLVLTDATALEGIIEGHRSLYQGEAWRAWLAPLGTWSIVALLIALTLLCVATLLRRQWDHERLTYPLEELPLAVSEPTSRLFRHAPFWAGAVIAAGLQFLNLAHQLQPAVPGVNLGVRVVSFRTPPWNAMGGVPLCFYPFAFGLSYLLPTDLSFSCIFFFLLTRFERVIAAAYGFTRWDGFPYVNQQASGAFIGFGLFVIWAARRHLAHTYQVAFRGRSDPDADAEPMSYRLAWLGFVAGGALLIAFTLACGMRFWVAATYWLLLLLMVLAVARIRAEVGLPSIELYLRGPDDMMRRAAGSLTYRPREMAVLTLFFWMHRTIRNYNLQHQLHGVRLATRTGLPMRRFAGALVLATAVGIVAAWWAYLHVGYDVGLQGGRFTGPANWAFGNEPWNLLSRRLQVPVERDRGGTVAFVFGGAMAWLLVLLRTRFVWWPLHPAGWVVADSFALMRLWIPISVTWAIKSSVLRWGGLRGYRQSLPFFLGLAVGEYTAGLVRTVIDLSWQLYLPVDSGIGGL